MNLRHAHPQFRLWFTFDVQCATLKHMSEVGIRALKQNASAVVAEAAAGETVTITDRGRPVARMSAIPKSRLRALIEEGHARPARGRLIDVPAPEPGPDLSSALLEMRDDERY
jgi:prevent-host-death family protein